MRSYNDKNLLAVVWMQGLRLHLSATAATDSVSDHLSVTDSEDSFKVEGSVRREVSWGDEID